MEPYVSEQEQVEQLRRWWKDNGKALLLGLLLGLGGLTGYRYWDAAQTARAESASLNYEQLIKMASSAQLDDALKAGHTIVEAYPGTTYAKLSTLLIAKLAVEKGDYAQAKTELRSLIDGSGQGEIGNVARARLARIMLAEGAADEADKLIAALPPVANRERYAELHGDILAARGDVQGARTKYLEALAAADKLGLDRESIQLKLDNLPAPAKISGS